MKENKQSLRKMWDNQPLDQHRCTWRGERKRSRKIFIEVMAENCLNLLENNDPHISDVK